MSEGSPVAVSPAQNGANEATRGTGKDSALRGFGECIHAIWGVIRDVLNVAGYVLLAWLIIYTLHKPDAVKVYLHNLGLNQIKAAGVELGFDVTGSADALAAVSGKVDELEKEIKEASTTISNPEAMAKIASAESQATALRQDVNKADENLRNAVAKQTQAVQSANAGASLVGWIFLGRTDESGMHWDTTTGSSPMPISMNLGPKFNAGDQITLQNSAYLRGDGPQYAITEHSIIGAVPGGATVRIMELKQNNIRSGGKYLWAKVNYAP